MFKTVKHKIRGCNYNIMQNQQKKGWPENKSKLNSATFKSFAVNDLQKKEKKKKNKKITDLNAHIVVFTVVAPQHHLSVGSS